MEAPALRIQAFKDLSVQRLYEILRLRSEVFVVEQDCVYLDPDGLDGKALHLTLYDGEELAGYARLLPPGVRYEEASIGRIVTAPSHRGRSLGRKILEEGIRACGVHWGGAIRISAQTYLESFYRDFGFSPVGEVYTEDGIDHIDMLRRDADGPVQEGNTTLDRNSE